MKQSTEKRVHYRNPPYLPAVPGGPVILEFKDMRPVELVHQPALSTKPSNVRAWPGLGLDSVELILGTRLRMLGLPEDQAHYEFRMYRGSPSLVPVKPNKWAPYYTP